jgi:hypothetical protein
MQPIVRVHHLQHSLTADVAVHYTRRQQAQARYAQLPQNDHAFIAVAHLLLSAGVRRSLTVSLFKTATAALLPPINCPRSASCWPLLQHQRLWQR